jgi:hypothetical protein
MTKVEPGGHFRRKHGRVQVAAHSESMHNLGSRAGPRIAMVSGDRRNMSSIGSGPGQEDPHADGSIQIRDCCWVRCRAVLGRGRGIGPRLRRREPGTDVGAVRAEDAHDEITPWVTSERWVRPGDFGAAWSYACGVTLGSIGVTVGLTSIPCCNSRPY